MECIQVSINHLCFLDKLFTRQWLSSEFELGVIEALRSTASPTRFNKTEKLENHIALSTKCNLLVRVACRTSSAIVTG